MGVTYRASDPSAPASSAPAAPSRLRGSGGARSGAERLLGTLGPIAAVLVLWQVVSVSGLVDRSFFPPPTRIAAKIWEMNRRGLMHEHLWVSLQRVALGFLVGAVPGVVLGLLMGWVGIVRTILDPIVTLIYPIPRIAILPLFLVIFGLGSPPIIAIAGLICFFPAVVTTYAGVRGLDANLPGMAKNLGASRLQILTKIAFPAAMPVMFAGLRLALGLALTGEVAAEFVAATTGIGAEIWRYWQIYRIEEMYANIVVIAAIGVILSFGLLEVQRRLLSWDEDIDLLR